MIERPTLWGRLVALIEGDVSADTLEVYRQARRAVYELLDQVEERRLDCKVKGLHPWTIDGASGRQRGAPPVT